MGSSETEQLYLHLIVKYSAFEATESLDMEAIFAIMLALQITIIALFGFVHNLRDHQQS